MKTPFKAWAQTYLNLGWSPIPIPSNEKHPVPDHSPVTGRPQHYTGAHGKYVDLPDLQSWCGRTGKARAGNWTYAPSNIAIRLPKLVLGIDVDTYDGKAGAATLAGAEKLWGELPPTWSSGNRIATPLSRILLFRLPETFKGIESWQLDWPESLKSAGASLGGGVELLRWDHRFAMVSPSVHPDGRVYFWRTPDGDVIDLAALSVEWAVSTKDGRSGSGAEPGDELEVELPDFADLAQLPDEWISGLTGERPGRHYEGGNGDGGDSNSGDRNAPRPPGAAPDLSREQVKEWIAERTLTLGPDMCAVMDRTLAQYLRKLRSAGDDGGAHDTARDAAWAVLGDAAAGHAGIEKALISLRQAFLMAVEGRRGGRGSGDRIASAEWSRIVTRGVSKIVAEASSAAGRGGQDGWADDDENALATTDLCSTSVVRGVFRTTGGKSRRANPFDYSRDDRGNARRLYNALGKGADVRWCEPLGGWFLWDPETGRWRPDKEGTTIRAIFHDIVDDMIVEAETADIENDKAREALLRFAVGCGNAGRIDNAVRTLRDLPGVAVEPEAFDSSERLLLCENGVVELAKDGPAFRPSLREDYLTISTGIPYIEDADIALVDDTGDGEHVSVNGADGSVGNSVGATRPPTGVNTGAALWLGFLQQCLPDPEVRQWVQAAVGYSLLGRNNERKMFICEGPTSTGKSTFVETIRSCLGGHGGVFNFSLFRSEREQGPNVALVRLLPKRFIVASEASQNKHLHADEIKRITGNEGVSGRLNNANDMVERVPAFTPWIATNAPPTINGADQALHRRLVTIPFNNQVDILVEDVDLGERLRTESGPAILAWAVRGWGLYTEGLLRNVPDKVRVATVRMRAELSDFAVWLTSRTMPGDTEIVTPTDVLYYDWETWCDTNNVHPGSKIEFGRNLARHGYTVARGRVGEDRFRGYRGLILRT